MAAEVFGFTSQMGRIWALQAPGEPPQYLKCHGAGDLAIQEGAITNLYCPSPSKRGSYVVKGRTQDPPDAPTWSLEATIGKTADFVERYSSCPLTFLLVQSECGDPRLLADYERITIFEDGTKTNRSDTGLATRSDDVESISTFDFEFATIDFLYPLAMTRQTAAAAEDLLDVTFANSARCQGACGSALEECEVGFISAASVGAAIANGYYTLNGGTTWTVWGAFPFIASENISSVVSFPMTPTTYRVIAARGIASAVAAPAEIAYSDDYGATWTLVDLPTADGDFIPWGCGLFALDRYHIWAVTDDGDVYFSDDAGVSWTEQPSANVASLNSIKFLDENYGVFAGAAGVIYTTTNGGDSWALVDPPAAQAAVICQTADLTDQYSFYTGWADGEIWFTSDGGANWTQQTLPVAAPNRVNDIAMVDRFVGFAGIKYTVTATIYGGILRTFDGGNSWELYTTVALDTGALGLNAVWPCTINKCFGVGDIATTSTIYVASD